jgi:hypothetical protein
MRVIICSLVGLSASLWFSVQAATSGDVGTVQQLGQLEQKYFHRTFDADTQESRTARLENFVYGEAVNGDLQPRIKKLSATMTPNDTLPQSQSQSQTVNQSPGDDGAEQADSDPQLSGSASIASQAALPQQDYPRIDALEKAILGQTYAAKPLSDRLAQMEKKAFGSVSKSDDLGDRTDALEKYAEKKLHKKLFPDEVRQADSSSSSGNGSGAAGNGNNGGASNMIGKQLLGMAAGSLFGIGSRGMMPMGMMPGFGGYGSGMGMGMGRQRSGQQRSAEPEASAPAPEDPRVFSATPPPAAARLLVKVGWCEVHVFGNTFPNMHLEERLQQLNETLTFAPGKSSLELMDDVGNMIKAVQARNHAPASISSSPQHSQ